MSKICACFYNDYNLRVGELATIGSTFDTADKKCWQSFVTDLDFKGSRKKIKEIVLTTLYDAVLEIESDEESKTFNFFGSQKEQRQAVSVCGKTFQFTFRAETAQCDIKKPMIVFDVVS